MAANNSIDLMEKLLNPDTNNDFEYDMEKELTKKSYNIGATQLSEKFEAFRAERAADIDHVFEFVHKENPDVLELGCGDGRDATAILRHTSNYTGVDYSTELLKIARQKNPDATFIEGDVETLEFPDNIDVVIALASLIHMDRSHLQDVLHRLHLHLAPGGLVRLSMKHGEYHKEMKQDSFGPRTNYFYTSADIKEIARGMFEVVWEDIQKNGAWVELILKKK